MKAYLDLIHELPYLRLPFRRLLLLCHRSSFHLFSVAPLLAPSLGRRAAQESAKGGAGILSSVLSNRNMRWRASEKLTFSATRMYLICDRSHRQLSPSDTIDEQRCRERETLTLLPLTYASGNFQNRSPSYLSRSLGASVTKPSGKMFSRERDG